VHVPKDEELLDRRKVVGQLVNELLTAHEVRGPDREGPVATPLADSAESFRLAVPRLLEFLVRGDANAQELAAELLAKRAHWIEKSDLNDFVVDALRSTLSKVEDPWVAHHLLAGVLLTSPLLSELNTRAIAKVATSHLLDQQLWPLRSTVVIGLLGDRMPRYHRKHVTKSVCLVIEQYLGALETDETLCHPEPERVLQNAVATLFALRKLIGSRDHNGRLSIPGEKLRAGCREAIWTIEEALEQAHKPPSEAYYHLLFAAAMVEPAFCPATQESLDLIGVLSQGSEPVVKHIVDRLKGGGGFVEDLQRLHEGFDPYRSEHTILLTSALMHTTGVVERMPCGIPEGTAWILYDSLSALRARIHEPFQAFFVTELQRALERQFSGL